MDLRKHVTLALACACLVAVTAKAGYDPGEAPLLWDRMAELGGGGTPEFLSTHPASERRAERLRSLLPKMKQTPATKVWNAIS